MKTDNLSLAYLLITFVIFIIFLFIAKSFIVKILSGLAIVSFIYLVIRVMKDMNKKSKELFDNIKKPS